MKKVIDRRSFITAASGAAVGIVAATASQPVLAANTGVPVSALDFMTTTERADVLAFGNSVNVTTALQSAINEAQNSKRELVFPAGLYRISSTLVFPASYMKVRGEGQVIIYSVEGGNNPVIRVGHPEVRIDALSFENLLLKTNGASCNGMEIRNTHRSSFSNIRVADCLWAAFLIDFSHSNEFRNLICSNNVDTFSFNPVYGIKIAGNSTANVFINPVMEAPIQDTGIYIDDGELNVFNGGVTESVPYGVAINSSSRNNTFVNFDFEYNTTCDISINGGSYNGFVSCWADSNGPNCVLIYGSATGNTFHGGCYKKVVLQSQTSSTKFFGSRVDQISGGGGYTSY